MSDKVRARTTFDILGKKAAGNAIDEIFDVLHLAPARATLAELWTAESASRILDGVASFSALLSQLDSHGQALEKLDAAIANMEKVRDEVLTQVYKQIRPLERSYKQIQLFFENSEVLDSVQRPPPELLIFNADAAAIRESSTIAALEELLQQRNDSLEFRQVICNLVVPGDLANAVRKRLEDISNKWGMLLIGDLRDERSFRSLSDQLRTDGGAYEFLKRPEEEGASHVVIAGYLKLREKHWFEEPDDDSDDADLYSPASMLFAGSLARADRSSGGGIAKGPGRIIFGKIRGVEKARIEPRISQVERLSTERPVMSIIRNEDDDLCFIGNRSQSQEPNGVLKFFTSYRVLRYLERRIAVYLRRIDGQRLTRELVKSQVHDPIEEFLRTEKQKGTVYDFNLDIDMAEETLAKGELDIGLEVLPVSPAETFNLKIDTRSILRNEAKYE